MKKFISTSLFSFLLLTFSALSLAGEQYTKRGYAVSGYDAVAYFTVGQPTKGNKEISTEWNNATWLFQKAHRDLYCQLRKICTSL